MSEKKRFLLRIDPRVHAAIEKWAADDLRSVNAQMEYLLSEALKRGGRYPRPRSPGEEGDGAPGGAPSNDPEGALTDGSDGAPSGADDAPPEGGPA